MYETRPAIDHFEDVRRPPGKGWRSPLEDGKIKRRSLRASRKELSLDSTLTFSPENVIFYPVISVS